MPKTTNITQYECDRDGCPVKEYVGPSETASPDWHIIKRINRNNEEKSMLLCGADYKEYLQLAENQDKDFDLWKTELVDGKKE
ncbi:hypothetical protein KIH77_08885 [Bifidobacterium sp. 82T24]|uniref:hypothetical protein n=1 Tax=Bifidobacterium pluvialisilvae TaxID=2834436 RepID=UPI001C58FFDF|nr:hypothetical protein [Bifidobacterium pluvialisilvae]MBW3088835.1 hypothetical protein [Bifidobacterium pluvialisilvae]